VKQKNIDYYRETSDDESEEDSNDDAPEEYNSGGYALVSDPPEVAKKSRLSTKSNLLSLFIPSTN
jgi:hypothetical protein